ncbi:MAG: hypothetical protein ABIH59_01990 [archaeon]
MCECYHKEIFGAGIIVAYFIFTIIVMFETIIKKWLRKFLE